MSLMIQRHADWLLDAPEQARETRGIVWIVAAFLICPCHLPLTLALIGTLASGTALANSLAEHGYLVGAAITAIWLAATLRGAWLMGYAETGAPGGTRTPDSQVRSLVLYPAELRARKESCGV